jgi:eukaryotic-like serine/threonine-protein kinase
VHEAETVNELMLAAMTKQAPPVASVTSGVPAPVAAVIDRALAYDQTTRWADARTMQAALRAAYQSFDRPSFTGAPAGYPGGAAVSGGYPAASAQIPMSAPTPMAAPSPLGAPILMGALPAPVYGAAAGAATGHPGTMMGGATRVVPQRGGGVPLVPVVSGLLGAIVIGMILLGTWVTLHKQVPAGSGSATVVATPPTSSAGAGDEAAPGAPGTNDAPAVGPDWGSAQPGAGDGPASSAGSGASGAPLSPAKRPAWIHKKHP